MDLSWLGISCGSTVCFAHLSALQMRPVLTSPYSGEACAGPKAANLGREGSLCWHPPLIILRNMPSIASFLHPGGSRAIRGKGELERCPKGRNVAIKEVEDRTELKESGFDCARLFPDCKQGPQQSTRAQKISPKNKPKRGETKQNKQNVKSIRHGFCCILCPVINISPAAFLGSQKTCLGHFHPRTAGGHSHTGVHAGSSSTCPVCFVICCPLLAVYVTWAFLYVTVYGFAPLDQLEQSRLFIKRNTACETQLSYPDHEKSNK